ncbi:MULTISPECIES: site-specific tyrosine recombinase/integron integrase [unclassified Halanaerobium]|uniref:site-specific tyrosine recombinase/integron integrase n=1 Tax=unclassified Halanaerobium TaxID=2641197 RepID=UPI000DF488D5|nr:MULTISPECIES: site-specific tyrosine recombinase/integron integrase [unclassified Halanaerobium]RCW51481.1 integrase/recombinase XerC [Halanaerobium sp. MA284_MarDTE_T2]RCW89269.1 integrase/recombinase XerC [Halanaerobium sp. DL-01]
MINISQLNFLQAVNKFKKYLEIEKGYSRLTIKEYDSDLHQLYDYLREELDFKENFSAGEVDRLDISEFLADAVIVNDNKAVTRNRKLFAIRSFYKYLLHYGIVNKNPAEAIESSKTDTRLEPIYLKLKEAQQFIKAIDEYGGINRLRDLAIVKLFLYAGLRISELVNLDFDNIDFDDGSIKFYGKGKKERYVPLHNDVILAIRRYMRERNSIKITESDARQAVFISRHGRRINPRTIQLFVKKYAKKAGLSRAEKITPHKLRHTFASTLYRQTKDIKVLQDLLGHSNISTTQIYTHVDNEEKKSAIDEMPDL